MSVEIDWAGIALVITAAGGAVAIIINALKTAKDIKETKQIAQAIDNAVNQKGPGEQTIGQEVSDLHSDRPSSPPRPRA